ncbi:hypothetical protein ES703_23794 [subsurface metagenome]
MQQQKEVWGEARWAAFFARQNKARREIEDREFQEFLKAEGLTNPEVAQAQADFNSLFEIKDALSV